ncbi:MAG: transposase [Isosphaeraceae bacterium]
MSRRRNADEAARLLREADRDLAKGLTISDICRKHGIAETTYYRWRQRHAPDQVDGDRRCRALELEVDRLKRLVAELLLDKIRWLREAPGRMAISSRSTVGCVTSSWSA